jgi:DNA-binding transcriptional LysR family regulator
VIAPPLPWPGGVHGLLDAVLAIARRGSFRTTQLELGVSTTALSNLIAKLERNLGVRLFNRTTRSVSLTDAGRNFVEQVGPALQEIHEAHECRSLATSAPCRYAGDQRFRGGRARGLLCGAIYRCTSISSPKAAWSTSLRR